MRGYLASAGPLAWDGKMALSPRGRWQDTPTAFVTWTVLLRDTPTFYTPAD
jgi:hypothetical protein